jgi:hypothetical protein
MNLNASLPLSVTSSNPSATDSDRSASIGADHAGGWWRRLG